MGVLVTGGAGYIGSHVVLALLDRGEPVVVLDDLSAGSRHAVPPSAAFVMGDVGDQRLVERTIRGHGIDTIMHLAGSVSVADSIADPLGYYLNNMVRSRSLIESGLRANARYFVFSSTAAVYGTPDRLPVGEDDPTHPATPYGRSKLMTEMMLRDAAAAHGLRVAILRYFNVAGADPALRAGPSRGGATHLIKAACDAALGRRPSLTIFGTDYPTPDGTCIRDYIHVSDLADLHRLALDRLRGGSDSFLGNCGYGHGHSVRAVVAAAMRVSGRTFHVRDGKRRPGDVAAMVADAGLIRGAFGWVPRHDDLEAIVRDGLAWDAAATDRTGA